MKGNTAKGFGQLDYYTFGMIMPEREFSMGGYRFGFNGKENDNEVKGEGNQQDYGMRIYDSRLGKFLSVDPITNEYPQLTPYQFASNSPILFIDIDGLEGGPTWAETRWSLTHISAAVTIKANADIASNAAVNSGLPNREDGLQDAFRHAYWSALNARDVGAALTLEFTNLHETSSDGNDPRHVDYNPEGTRMDLNNNTVGIDIGQNNPNATDEELQDRVMLALNKGQLQILKMAPNDAHLDKNNNVTTNARDFVRVPSNDQSWHPPLAMPPTPPQQTNQYLDVLTSPTLSPSLPNMPGGPTLPTIDGITIPNQQNTNGTQNNGGSNVNQPQNTTSTPN